MYENSIAQNINIAPKQVAAVLNLLAEGSTIPFIARYRKDVTGALDEVQIAQIQDEQKRLQEFDERKAFIIKTIEEQGKMTDALMESVNKAITLTQLEDIYLPYKQKRKTKAVVARENGLQPLADLLMLQNDIDFDSVVPTFFNENILTAEAALQGARDIIAETINEDISVREKLRKLFEEQASIKSMVVEDKKEQAAKFKDYFEYSEKIATIPSHRTLAVLRGFLEGFLKIAIEPAEEDAIYIIEDAFIKNGSNCKPHLQKAIKDAYKRLLQPSLETEYRSNLKQAADEEAINVFAENLKQLLLSSPLGSKTVLAIDPGYRTGCKVVCLGANGDLLDTNLIFVHEKNRIDEAKHTINYLIQKHNIQAFAIGDGTAGRETEQFIKSLQTNLPVFLVNEDGASIYSASEIGRAEFPDYDITVRGAVSIGRRLMDPLAELVKLDPKSIGVGQYQHDVNQARLKEKLDATVASCVNSVGVNLNTASKHLLAYVSGIGSTIADNIVQYRKQNGAFKSKKDLLQIPRLGNKAYEQCAGFIRIPNAENPLDESAVHPEAYGLVETIASDLKIEVKALIRNENLINSIEKQKYISEQFGMHTVADVLMELKKPGLDPRADAQTFEFAQIYSIEEVTVGMELPGIVTNLTRFGAFVDIGVKQDGLVHVSEIAHKYISDPSEVLKLNQKVKVKVTEVDIARKRIALSIKQTEEAPNRKAAFVPKPKGNNVPEKPSSNNMQDALASLKNKFR
jgi:protein Tex